METPGWNCGFYDECDGIYELDLEGVFFLLLSRFVLVSNFSLSLSWNQIWIFFLCKENNRDFVYKSVVIKSNKWCGFGFGFGLFRTQNYV